MQEDPLTPRLRRHLHQSLMVCDSLDEEPWRIAQRPTGHLADEPNGIFMSCPGPEEDPIVLEALVTDQSVWRQLERDTAKELGLR